MDEISPNFKNDNNLWTLFKLPFGEKARDRPYDLCPR